MNVNNTFALFSMPSPSGFPNAFLNLTPDCAGSKQKVNIL